MIPTLWRSILLQYAQVFGLSLLSFLAILLATKLEDFAAFIGMGAPLGAVVLFVAYQVPYVLQIALPLSSLIAALYVWQRLSHNHALSAVRAAGMSLTSLLTPLLLASCLLSLVTFRYVLDASAIAHRQSKELEHQLKSLHPLTIIHNSKLLEQRGVSLDMQGSLDQRGEAANCIIALRCGKGGNALLVLAKELHLVDETIEGHNLSLITTQSDPEQPQRFDHLIIENTQRNRIALKDLSLLTHTKRLRIGNDALRFPLLLAKRDDLQRQLASDIAPPQGYKHARHLLARAYAEIARRISLSLAIVTFALLGMAYGCHVGRVGSKRRIATVMGLTALYLICFLGAKATEEHTALVWVLYMAPHVVLISAASLRLWRLQRGVCEG